MALTGLFLGSAAAGAGGSSVGVGAGAALWGKRVKGATRAGQDARAAAQAGCVPVGGESSCQR